EGSVDGENWTELHEEDSFAGSLTRLFYHFDVESEGWNFFSIWNIDSTNNNGYPYFVWSDFSNEDEEEEEEPTPTPPKQSGGRSGGGGQDSNQVLIAQLQAQIELLQAQLAVLQEKETPRVLRNLS